MTASSSDDIDPSNGWEAIAETFIREREWSTVGVARIQSWSRSLPDGASVLDLGCGPGTPHSKVLIDNGFRVHAVDASPSLLGAYRQRFQDARVACEKVEESPFFGLTFDGALAWGLLFLLPADSQRNLIHRVAKALNPGGRFLFTAPAQVCTWKDLSTARPSWSLGAAAYKAELASAGFTLVGEHDDEGENHYYDAVKRQAE